MGLSGEVGRRALFRGAAGAAVIAGVSGGTAADAAPAAESAGQGRRLRNDQIGLQLFTVRDAFMADPEGTTRALADIGYETVELAGLPPGFDAQRLRRLFDRFGVRARSSHHGFADVANPDRLRQIIADAKALGQRYVVCPGGIPDFTVEGFTFAAGVFNQVGAECRRAGLVFGYHNHETEFRFVDGQLLHDILIDETDPRLVTMEVDVHWVYVGRGNPYEVIWRHPDRVRLFHVKGLRPDLELTDVGSADDIIDWGPLFRFAITRGVEEYIIENDDPNDPRTSPRSKNMYDFVRNLRF